MKPLPKGTADRWADALWALILCEALGIPTRRRSGYRRHVSPAELMLVGKESNNIEAVERGLIGSWRSVLDTYSA